MTKKRERSWVLSFLDELMLTHHELALPWILEGVPPSPWFELQPQCAAAQFMPQAIHESESFQFTQPQGCNSLRDADSITLTPYTLTASFPFFSWSPPRNCIDFYTPRARLWQRLKAPFAEGGASLSLSDNQWYTVEASFRARLS